eukprot:scaffold45936_cov23-Tisochrysis_lutea.AAC.1
MRAKKAAPATKTYTCHAQSNQNGRQTAGCLAYVLAKMAECRLLCMPICCLFKSQGAQRPFPAGGATSSPSA